MPLDEVTLNFDSDRLWLLNAIIALIMFGVALDLRVGDFTRLLRSPRGPLVGLAAQFLVLPAATFVLTMLLRPGPSIALGMLLIAACPGGNLSNFLTNLAGGNTALSVTMTAISTAVAMAMTPINVSYWASMNPDTAPLLVTIDIDHLQLVLTVVLILGIPLGLGMSCAHLFPRLSDRLHTPMKYFSIIFFLSFVVFVFSQNYEIFTTYIEWVAVAVISHNLLAFATGYSLSRLMGLDEWDRRAVTIEVGIQNSALGLVLIFSFFDGLGGMAIVAGVWGIWHIISGLSLALYWSRNPAAVAGAATAGESSAA